jgi:hypothetical protein
MQDYRYERVHETGCTTCAPDSPGHRMCQHGVCGEIAETQYRRHATEQEYAAIPENHQPRDGVAHQAVFVCLDHEPDPICGGTDHSGPEPEHADPQACPKCLAPVGEPCVKANGKRRTADHKARATANDAPPAPQLPCMHAHRPDCEGLGACQCTADDTAPVREPYAIG